MEDGSASVAPDSSFNPLSYAVAAARDMFDSNARDAAVLKGMVIMLTLALLGVTTGAGTLTARLPGEMRRSGSQRKLFYAGAAVPHCGHRDYRQTVMRFRGGVATSLTHTGRLSSITEQ